MCVVVHLLFVVRHLHTESCGRACLGDHASRASPQCVCHSGRALTFPPHSVGANHLLASGSSVKHLLALRRSRPLVGHIPCVYAVSPMFCLGMGVRRPTASAFDWGLWGKAKSLMALRRAFRWPQLPNANRCSLGLSLGRRVLSAGMVARHCESAQRPLHRLRSEPSGGRLRRPPDKT